MSDEAPATAIPASRNLLTYLQSCQVPAVQRVVVRYTLGGKPATSLQKMQAQVAAVLTSPAALDRLIASLTPFEREALEIVKRQRGVCDAWALATRLALRGLHPDPGRGASLAALSWLGGAGARDYAAPLLDDGLLFRIGHGYSDYDAVSRHDPWLFADPRVLARLPLTAARIPTALALPVVHVPQPTAPHPLALVLELLSSLQVVHDLGGLHLNRDQTINRNFERRALRERPERSTSLARSFHWLYRLGWIQHQVEDSGSGTRLPLPVDRVALDSHLNLPPAALYGLVVDALAAAGDDLVDANWTVGRYHAAPRSSLHAALLDALALIPERPVDAREAADRIWEAVLVRAFGWPKATAQRMTEFRQRPPAVLAILTRSFVRAGLLASDHPFDSEAEDGVHLAPALGSRWYRAWSAASRQIHDRTGLAAELAAVTTPAPGPALIVGANFEVLVYLDRLATPALPLLMATTIRRIDHHTATATLDRASVNRALALGGDIDAIVGGFERYAGSIPRNVEQSLRDWAGRRERLRVSLKTRLLEFPNAVARDAALARWAHARAVGERFLLLDPQGPPLTEGEAMTLAPRISGSDYRNRPRPHIQFQPNGLVRVEGVPDLVTRALLGALTRSKGDGSRWLDRDALAAYALPGAWRTLLKERLRTPLPAHLEALLETWGGEASAPGLRSATLFTHPNATAWAQHPSLAPYLKHPLNAQTYLLETDAVPAIQAALAALGLTPVGSTPAAAATAPTPAAAPPLGGPQLLEGLSTRRLRELLEGAIELGGEVELRYAVENERYDRYGRVKRTRGRTRTRSFQPLEIRYRGSLPYLLAVPLRDSDEELIRIGFIEAIAVRAQ